MQINPLHSNVQHTGWLWTFQKYDWMGRVIRKITTDGDPQQSSNASDVFITYEGCGCAGGLVTTIEGELVPRTDTAGNARRKQKAWEASNRKRSDLSGSEIIDLIGKVSIWGYIDGNGTFRCGF